MTGRTLALGLAALAVTGITAWRLGWRQGHAIARYQAAVDAVLDPSIDHSGCANTIGRLSSELAQETRKTAILASYVTWQEGELDRLRGRRLLSTPESLAFDELVEREFPS